MFGFQGAISPAEFIIKRRLEEIFPELDSEIIPNYPEGPDCYRLEEQIINMNDYKRMAREDIADVLDGRGYTRLADAIRVGIRVDGPQAFGQYITPDGATCVLGAAYLGAVELGMTKGVINGPA